MKRDTIRGIRRVTLDVTAGTGGSTPPAQDGTIFFAQRIQGTLFMVR